MGFFAELDHGRSDLNPAAGRQVGDAEVEIYVKLVTGRFLTVPDPKLAVLKDSPRLFRAIRVRLTEPPARAS